MACNRCADLCQEVAIRTPGELDRVVRVVSGNLDDRTLIEAVHACSRRDVIEPTPFAELMGETRPDMIKCDFECVACGERFRLRCETYHGSGGSWTFGVCT